MQEAVVAALVSKTMPKALGHISSLKHLTDVKLCRFEGASKDSSIAFCCPISGQPLNGQHRFCLVQPSGHVISEKAISQASLHLSGFATVHFKNWNCFDDQNYHTVAIKGAILEAVGSTVALLSV